MKWFPTIEPNKYYSIIKDAYGNACVYVVRAGNAVAYPNRPYMGNEQLWLQREAPHNELWRERFASAANVESVVHEYDGKVIVWHYMDPVAGYWSMPSTDDVRARIDSLGYKRVGKVSIVEQGIRLPRHEYVVADRDRGFGLPVEIKTMGEWS